MASFHRIFRPQFSLRTMLIAMALIAAPLALIAHDFHTASRRLEAIRQLEAEGHYVLTHNHTTWDNAFSWRFLLWMKISNHPGFHSVKEIELNYNANLQAYSLVVQFPEAEELIVRAERLEKASADRIGRSLRLKKLRLRCSMEAGALQALVDTVNRLEELEVHNAPDLNECDFSGKLPRLRSLHIYSSTYTGANLRTLMCCETLEEISIVVPGRLVNDAFEGIDRFSELNTVTIFGAHLSNSMLRDLAKLRGLQTLSFSNCTFPDDWPEQPFDWPELHWLNLSHSNVTDSHLQSFQNCLALRVVEVVGCPLGDESVEVLTRLPNLTALYLSETQVTKEGVLPLLSCRKLEQLWLSKSLANEGLKQIFAQSGNCRVAFSGIDDPFDF